eukprot:COSAG02_NODE_123_length_35269_cov_51.697526_15_plen_123_part_00
MNGSCAQDEFVLLMSMTEDDAQEDPNSGQSAEGDGVVSDAGEATEDNDRAASRPSVRYDVLFKLPFVSCYQLARIFSSACSPVRPVVVPIIGCSVARAFSPHSRRLWRQLHWRTPRSSRCKN